jgi:hypothetical protein
VALGKRKWEKEQQLFKKNMPGITGIAGALLHWP